MDWIKKAGLYALAALVSVIILGSMTGMLMEAVSGLIEGEGFNVAFHIGLFLAPSTWLTGAPFYSSETAPASWQKDEKPVPDPWEEISPFRSLK